MKKFQVITDTTSDIEKKFRDEFGLDYVKMVFTIEGKDYAADLDWPEITASEYYAKMRRGNRSITGLVTTEEFEKKFTQYLEKGMDILYIACSSKLSGSLNNGILVANELLDKYPDRRIVCFDSLRSNYAEGSMAMDAAKMSETKTLDAVVEYLNENKLKYQTYATVGSLEWLKKAGRVKASAAFFGNLFGVKPVILGDAQGNNYAFKKVKGRLNSLDELVNIILERIENPMESTVYIEHADSVGDALYIKQRLEGKVGTINISELGPIIGATTGPDTITVNFYGEKVTIVGEM